MSYSTAMFAWLFTAVGGPFNDSRVTLNKNELLEAMNESSECMTAWAGWDVAEYPYAPIQCPHPSPQDVPTKCVTAQAKVLSAHQECPLYRGGNLIIRYAPLPHTTTDIKSNWSNCGLMHEALA